jgi:hypothetical protein
VNNSSAPLAARAVARRSIGSTITLVPILTREVNRGQAAKIGSPGKAIVSFQRHENAI